MERVINRGIQVVIPPDSGRHKGTRPGWDKGLYAFMRGVLSTEHGQAVYRRRLATVEPVRTNEVQPAARSLLTPRASGVPLGMAPNGRHPQAASQPPHRRRGGLNRPPRPRQYLATASAPTRRPLFPTATDASGSGTDAGARELSPARAGSAGRCPTPPRCSCWHHHWRSTAANASRKCFRGLHLSLPTWLESSSTACSSSRSGPRLHEEPVELRVPSLT